MTAATPSDINALAARISAANPRVTIASAVPFEVPGLEAYELSLGFRHTLPTGGETEGSGRLYVPGSVLTAPTGARLFYHAGYELAPEGAIPYLGQGIAVVTPRQPVETEDTVYSSNPLARGLNLDVALLHISRRLPFVDQGKIFITGGSAGGFAGLMMAAESFPLAGVLVSSPVVNVPYTFSYVMANFERTMANAQKVPYLAGVSLLPAGSQPVLGPDPRAQKVLGHAPVSHLHEMTCRIQVVHSTADLLVPIDQVDPALAVAPNPAEFPEGFVISPADVGFDEPIGTLIDGVGAGVFHEFEVPDDSPLYPTTFPPDHMPDPIATFTFPWPDHGWAVVILKEGAPAPLVGHFKYVVGMGQDWARIIASYAGDDPGQMTVDKLALLMKRLSGVAWTDESLSPLDYPEDERADVLAGLRWWCQDAEREAVFRTAYAALPAQLMALGPQPDLG